jgi:hypothetical protein
VVVVQELLAVAVELAVVVKAKVVPQPIKLLAQSILVAVAVAVIQLVVELVDRES